MRKGVQMKICFVVGRNGVGKSHYLIEQAHRKEASGTILVCNTIHDKSQRLKLTKRFSAKNPASRPNTIIKSILKKMLSEGSHRLNQMARVLDYCGYAPYLRVRVGATSSYLTTFSSPYPQDHHAQLLRVASGIFRQEHSAEFYVHFDEEFRVSDLSLLEVLLNEESELRRNNIISPIEISLINQNREYIPLQHASSGQLSLITSFMFILSEIKDAKHVFIDEPENSLHPLWQREYVSKLVGLLGYHEVEVTIATHSPLIVTGAQLNADMESMFYHPETDSFSSSDALNIEETLWEQFETIPPESRYFSEKLSSVLGKLASHKATLDETLSFLKNAEGSSFDPRQQVVFEAARKLAYQIQENKN
jgi:predicted ATPase